MYIYLYIFKVVLLWFINFFKIVHHPEKPFPEYIPVQSYQSCSCTSSSIIIIFVTVFGNYSMVAPCWLSLFALYSLSHSISLSFTTVIQHYSRERYFLFFVRLLRRHHSSIFISPTGYLVDSERYPLTTLKVDLCPKVYGTVQLAKVFTNFTFAPNIHRPKSVRISIRLKCNDFSQGPGI